MHAGPTVRPEAAGVSPSERDYFSDGDAPPASQTRPGGLGRSKSKDLTRRVSFGRDQILGYILLLSLNIS